MGKEIRTAQSWARNPVDPPGVAASMLRQSNAARHDARDVKIGSENHQIRVRAYCDDSFFSGEPEAPRGENRCHANRVNHWDAEFHQVANRAINRQRASREFSLGVTNHAVSYLYLKTAQFECAVAHARRCGTVADQQHCVETFGAEQDLNRRARDVHSIGDNFRSDVRVSEHGTDYAGVAVGEWPHRIVNMYRMPRPSLNRRP